MAMAHRGQTSTLAASDSRDDGARAVPGDAAAAAAGEAGGVVDDGAPAMDAAGSNAASAGKPRDTRAAALAVARSGRGARTARRRGVNLPVVGRDAGADAARHTLALVSEAIAVQGRAAPNLQAEVAAAVEAAGSPHMDRQCSPSSQRHHSAHVRHARSRFHSS